MANIKIRNKLLDALKRAEISENYLDGAIAKAMALSMGTLKNVLWNMSFTETQDYGLKVLGLYTSTIQSDLKIIPTELVSSFRNELRWQYTSNINEAFLKPRFVNTSFDEIYKNFSQKIGDDVIAYVILEKTPIFFQSFNHFMIKRTFELLNSSKENQVVGGLKNLGLKAFQANALKSHSKDIALFLSNIYKLISESENEEVKIFDNEVPEEKIETKQFFSPAQNTPFAKLGEMLQNYDLSDNSAVQAVQSEPSSEKESNPEETETTPEQHVLVTESEVSPLVSKIMESPDLIDDLIAIFDEVEKAGFNPMEIYNKKEKIKKFLDSYFNLLEAASHDL